MRLMSVCLAIVFVFGVLDPAVLIGQESKQEKITYEDHVKPIFRQHCFSCHNQNKKEGDLDLTNYTGLMQGGGSGEVIDPGSVDDSYLFALVNHDDEPAMPPEQPKIAEEKIAVLSKWIELGALENVSSKAKIKKKKTFDFALADPAVGRPSVTPVPAKLDLEPIVHTSRTTGVTALATSPWAPLVAMAGQKQVLLYDSKSRELKGVFPFPEGIISVLKFSRNGALLLAGGGRGGANGKVVVWNIKNGDRIIEVGDELDTVLAADISSDQKLIALGGPQRMIRVYSTADNSLVYEIKKHTDWVTSLEFSPDGVLLATGDRNGGVHVWEAFSGREYLTLKAHTKAITGISWRLDSNIVATTSEDATIRLWEMNNGSQVKNWGAHGVGSLAVEFTRDGRLVSAGRDKVSKIWDQNGKQLFAFPAFPDIAMRVTHCDESNTCVAGDWSGEIRQFNAVDGKQIALLTSNPRPLEKRLVETTKELAELTATSTTLKATATADQAALTKLSTDIALHEKLVADLTQKIKVSMAKIEADGKAQQLMNQQIVTLKSHLGALGIAVPELQKAKQSSALAASKLGADAELKKIAEDVGKLFTAKEAELKAKNVEMANLNKSLAEKTTGITAEKGSLTKSMEVMGVAKQKITTWKPLLKPAEEKYAKSKAAADAAVAAVSKSTAEVSRWKEAIAFSKSFRDLKSRIGNENEALVALEIAEAEVQEQASAKKQNMINQMAAMNATKTQAAEKENELNGLRVKVDASQKMLAFMQSEMQKSSALMKQTQDSVPLLSEARVKIEAAQKVSPGDQDLAASLKAVTTLIEKQSAEAAVLQQAIAQKNTEMAEMKKELDLSSTAMQSAEKMVADLKAKLTVEQKEMIEAEKAMQEAAAAVVAAGEKVKKKTSEITSLRQQVSELQGIPSST